MSHMVLMGKRLKALRKQKGFKTQKEFAARANVNNFAIDWRRYGAIERGDVKPDVEEVLMICLIMGISADEWILNRKPHYIPRLNALTEDELQFITQIVGLLAAMRPR